MNARSLSLPAAPRLAAPARARPPAARSALALRIAAAFVGTGAAVAVLTALAVTELSGATAWWAGGLGGVALLAVAALGTWLQLRVVRPAFSVSAAAAHIARGDLTRPLDAAAAGEFRSLVQSLEQVRSRLFTVVSEVRTGTANVAMNSSQVTRDNEALAIRTRMQAEALQQTAATMEQMTAAVRHNADTAQQATTLVRTASARAGQGGEVMDEVVQTMAAIRGSSNSIRDIIAVIDGIAFQTNILALNAAVEAARAGEQGRGFAVVAAEVRTLSQRCAGAAREIRDLIVASVGQVERGGARVDEAGRSMAEIVAAVRQVAELIVHIDAASREQSDGIEAINGAVANIDRNIQANGALVHDATRTAAALHERAVALLRGVAGFDLGAREHGNADEATAMVRAACEFLRVHGRDALLAEVNKLSQGRFIDRDLYLMVIDANTSLFAGHGNNPRTLGQGGQSKDVDGKLFVLEMTRVARDQGEGWVDYKWAHPVTNEVLTKSTFVRKVGDLVVACGIYR
jgi:methyl-accepting chemotaxis protein